jgi:hypothetical protein
VTLQISEHLPPTTTSADRLIEIVRNELSHGQAWHADRAAILRTVARIIEAGRYRVGDVRAAVGHLISIEAITESEGASLIRL